MSRSVRQGFTLIELMVVAAIIVALLVVTMPALLAVMASSKQAQSENILRSSVMAARAYAIQRGVIAGVRFQEDGRIVQIYVSNMAQTYTPDSFRTLPQYRMKAVEGESPHALPQAYRVMAYDYRRNDLARATPHWWGGQQWYRCCVALFNPRGRLMQAACVFPNSGTDQWFPTMAGAFGTLTYAGPGDPVFDFQGNCGVGWPPPTGPAVATQFRLYDWGPLGGYMQNPSVTQSSDGTYVPNSNVARAMGDGTWSGPGIIDSVASDFVIDVNSGMLIRLSADLDTTQ